MKSHSEQAKTAFVPTPASSFAPDSLAAGLTAALDWWREAGVDHDFLDDPRDWLPPPPPEPGARPAAVVAPPPPEPEKPKFGGAPDTWPQTLADFAPWWLAEPLLDAGRTSDRVAPRGVANPALMIIVPEPESGDAETGRLLSGRQGKLLAAMLPALGLSQDQVYIAAALPRTTPAADWAALGDSGLGAVLAHHIALVGPARVLALGGNILPLLGHELPQNPAILPIVNQQEAGQTQTGIPALAAPDPATLLDRPGSKAGLWQRWLRWTV